MGGGSQREGHGARIWPKKHKKPLISEYLAADLSADASADALAIINIGSVSIIISTGECINQLHKKLEAILKRSCHQDLCDIISCKIFT